MLKDTTTIHRRGSIYCLLQKELLALVEECQRYQLANASALLWQGLENINWVGFYLIDGGCSLGLFRASLPACIFPWAKECAGLR